MRQYRPHGLCQYCALGQLWQQRGPGRGSHQPVARMPTFYLGERPAHGECLELITVLKVGGGVPTFGRITHALDLANTPGDSAILVPALRLLRLGLRRLWKRMRTACQLHRLF